MELFLLEHTKLWRKRIVKICVLLLSLLHKTSCTSVNVLLLLFIINFAHSSVVCIPKSLILRVCKSLKLSFIS